jgi:N-acetylglucosaminyldiphosphoundecaprenol N-acetyl-beta-D-mannosaminyltransferase
MFHDLTLLPSEQWLLFLAAGAAVGVQGSVRCAVVVPQLAPRPQIAVRSILAPCRVRLFGMTLDALDMAGAVRTILQWRNSAPAAACRYVVTPNVDHVVKYQSNPALRAAYAGASLVLADGTPVVAASRLLGKPLPERVAGSDLVPALFDAASQAFDDSSAAPLRVFLLGAGPGVAERAAWRVHQRWSGVDVVGTLSPPLDFENDPAQNERILRAVAETQPDVVLIGLGAPKQELWIARHAERLAAGAALCVGATIDFLAGEKSRSPQWMQRCGLEWLHRLASEPTRLAQRYLHDAWVFPQLIWREWVA